MPLRMLESISPRTGAVLGRVRIAEERDVHVAVDWARRVQPAWGALSLTERLQKLEAAGRHLAREGTRLEQLISQEMGRPFDPKDNDTEGSYCGKVELGRKALREMAAAFRPERLRDKATGRVSVVHQVPLGVVGVITPWNFPIEMPNWLIVPALLAGNSVVFKPSEETPLVGEAYAQILQQVLPAGVLEVIHGQEDVGKALVASGINMVAFTGSKAAGQQILAAAADGIKRVLLEMGGMGELVVMRDGDLQKAAAFVAANGTRNSGQVCVSTQAVFVHEDRAAEFEPLLGDEFKKQTIGTMVNREQAERVLEIIEDARAKGARVVSFGDHEGAYVAPTLIFDVTPAMRIANEEVFGPVVGVRRFRNVDEVVTAVNGTGYGLAGVIFSRDVAAAKRLALRLKTGMVGINGSKKAPGTPWTGAQGLSGYGFHMSRDGYRQFSQPKVVSFQG